MAANDAAAVLLAKPNASCCTASSSTHTLDLLAVAPPSAEAAPADAATGLFAGMSMEIRGFRGRLELNGAAVKLVSLLPSKRWAVLVIHANPPETINVKPENLVAIGSQDFAVYESIRADQQRRRDEEMRAEQWRRDEEMRRQERLKRVREEAARAKSADRTTDLTHDARVSVCHFLNLSQLGKLLLVCKAWSPAARAAAHDPTWQLTMLSADEFKRYIVRSNALPISLTTRQRWGHVNPIKFKQAHSATEAKAAGFTIEQMKAAGYNSYQCNVAGFSLEELTSAGHMQPSTHTAQEAKAAGYTIEQMRAAGYVPYQCKVLGFSFEEARRAGFQPSFSDDAARDYWFSTEKECRYWG
eukprot:jgi/Chrpa1/7497/Chrysochromulina_OHIO_Genome00012779-RA